MSSNSKNSGILRIVATPLGNPGDLSPRARQVLEEADLVLAEDCKREGLACARWGVNVRAMDTYNDHNEQEKFAKVMTLIRSGKNIALISDAGMPVISDPGYILIKECRKEGIPVTVIPGPCAVVTALAGSGIPPQPFVFFGFLPRKQSDIEKVLAPFVSLNVTIVFYERKDRLAETLKIAYSLLGNRDACIARELTKTYEEYLRFRLKELPDCSQLLGEVTVVIGQPEQSMKSEEDEVNSVIREERQWGGSPRAIARRVQARVCGWTTGEIYSLLTREKSV